MRPDPAAGVFETLLVRGGRVQAPEAHLERLGRSVSELYATRLPAELLRSILARAAGLSGTHRLRVDAIPEPGGIRIELRDHPVDDGPPAPVACAAVTMAGGLGNHKWCDRRLLESLSVGDAVPLLIDDNGDVLEAAWANVWLVEAGRLITPPADGRLLPGVTRALLLVLAPLHSLDVRVEPITLERIRAASAMFLTSSVRVVVAAGLDEPPNAEPGAVTTIRAALQGSSWA
jgi:para-aminobenzoate synthetase/4-amino-4-deoxychorismate lyase